MSNIGFIFETIMLALFALSWPINISKTIRARTAKGKSLGFELLVWVGYVCGTVGKLIGFGLLSGENAFDISKHYVLLVYILDLALVTIDIVLTLRNMRLDRQAENK